MASATSLSPAADRLRDMQTLMAVCSDLDVSLLHPPSSDRSPMPMSSLILWDVERLKRLSRWRICDDPGRETLRAYARTILALHELEEAAEKLPMNSMTCSTPTAPT